MKQAQHERHERSTVKKVQKRINTRKRRQAERLDPETAPIKNRYRNYTG